MAVRVTVVGEALVDLVLGPEDVEPRAHPGGGPANIAVGLARLGHQAVLLTCLGDDDHGRLVREHLVDNGVDVVDVGAPGSPTSTALARLDGRGVAAYEFDLVWDVRDLSVAQGSAALHVGSLGLALEPGDTAVLELTRATSAAGEVLVSYDPNARPSLTPDRSAAAQRVLDVAALAHLVKCSDEDLEFLFPGTAPEDFAERLLGLGSARLVVVTLGADGVFLATAGGSLRVPPYAVDVVDTVGAGDSFMSGLLDGLARSGALSPGAFAELTADGPARVEPLARRAAAVAAITCSRAGANPPRPDEVDEFLRQRS
ncbi:MAG: carbohydrate kinase family protein [Motilibacteraceae bacterium]